MIDRIRKAGDSDSEKLLATNLQQNLDQRKTWEAKKQAAPQIAEKQNGEIATTTRIETEEDSPSSTSPATQESAPEKQGRRRLHAEAEKCRRLQWARSWS